MGGMCMYGGYRGWGIGGMGGMGVRVGSRFRR